MRDKIQWNVPMQTPIKNHHYGFKFLEKDFEGRHHPGEDLNGPGAWAADRGTPVKPIAPGVVSFVDKTGTNYGWGDMCYVRHDMIKYFKSFGVEKPDWCPDKVWSQYVHLDDVYVVEGQEVGVDDVIGPLGGTPYWSPHLHHEVRKMPLGVYFYPGKNVTKEWIKDHYFKPSLFVQEINAHVRAKLAEKEIPAAHPGLIKYEKQPEVYIYNGKTRHHVPDEETAILLFGPDWYKNIQMVSRNDMAKIKVGNSLPTLKVQ